MDEEIKREFDVLNDKLDGYIANQEKICALYRKPIENHIKDGAHFRDKLVKVAESQKAIWSLLLLLIGGIVGGFFWMLKTLPK